MSRKITFLQKKLPQGLMIKPFIESGFYEIDEDHFGIYFPTGIEAKQLAEGLKKENKERF